MMKNINIAVLGLVIKGVVFCLGLSILSCSSSTSRNNIEVNKVINGKKEGIHLKKTSIGTTLISYYKGNKLNGIEIEMDSKDKLSSIFTYKNGIENGFGYAFYPSGKLDYIKEWKNGRKTNDGVEFYENGKPRFHKKYNENGYVIYERSYDSTGKILKTVDYVKQ